MKFADFFKTSFKQENPTVRSILNRYDSNEFDVRDGKYSKDEVSCFISDSIIPIGTFLLGKRFLTNSVFKFLDKDKDDYITMTEIDDYLGKEYNVQLKDIKNLTAMEVCKILDDIDEQRKKIK